MTPHLLVSGPTKGLAISWTKALEANIIPTSIFSSTSSLCFLEGRLPCSPEPYFSAAVRCGGGGLVGSVEKSGRSLKPDPSLLSRGVQGVVSWRAYHAAIEQLSSLSAIANQTGGPQKVAANA
jgi:hypothetical protein